MPFMPIGFYLVLVLVQTLKHNISDIRMFELWR